MSSLIIIGASGHGEVVADIAELNGYDILFLDDDESKHKCGQYSVAGTSKDIEKYRDSEFFVAVGNADIRERIMNGLTENGFSIATLIHPNAVIARDCRIGTGSVVMAGAVINPNSVIGKGCIVNTGATVDHDNTIGDYSHISVGSHLAGTVSIGNKCWLGIGSVVSNNIDICDKCIIGAGAVVIRNISESGVYVGVPARKIK